MKKALLYELTGNMFFGTLWQLRAVGSEVELFSSPFKLWTRFWALLHGYGWPPVYRP